MQFMVSRSSCSFWFVEYQMPNKRSRRNQTQKFHCPLCQRRIWRVGGPKYHLFYQGKSEIQKNLNLTSKKASFLAAQSPTVVDCNVWLEEFLCEEDGKLWIRLAKSSEGLLTARLATVKDWERSVRTPDPDMPNSTVSEYSYRMSRRVGQDLSKRYSANYKLTL